jgi:putative SOS response-associated peptidase YedK
MCGRFTLRSTDKLRVKGVPESQLPALTARYNIAPGQEVLVVTESPEGREAALLHWGLTPSWSAERAGLINARAETLETKPSFAEALQKRRCLIIADGFYEWKRELKTKQPYFFQMVDESHFAFAGIWDRWQRDGVTLTSCAIITTTANELLASVHDRMPVILSEEAQDRWLNLRTSPAELKLMLTPFPAAKMKSFPVASDVNQARVEDGRLVEPVDLNLIPRNGMLF